MKEFILSLTLDKDTSALRGKSVRKAICALYPDNSLFSQHDEGTGNTIKRYPRIQYRVMKNQGIMIYGVKEGADMLEKIYPDFPQKLRIATEYENKENVVEYKITGRSIRMSEFPDNLMGKTTLYRTITPLVLIDRAERYAAYNAAESPETKFRLLQGWLTNNFVNIAHELEVPLQSRVTVGLIELAHIPIKKKGIDMIGLKGQFATNMRLGNLGIGHFSSHGFGLVQKIRI